MMSWARNDVLRFIEIYRNHDCLWRQKCKDYSDRKKKDSAYDKLVQFARRIEPNFNRDDAIKKINNLRSSFRKELKKIERSRISVGDSRRIHTPKLYYFYELMFLKDQEDQRPEDYDTCIIPDSTPTLHEVKHEPLSEGSSCISDDADTETTDNLGLEPNFQPSSSTAPNTEILYQALTRKNPKRKAPEEEETTHPYDYYDSNKTEQPDKHDIFGQHVANNLREMSNDQQIVCMKIISDALFEGSLGNLSRKTCLNVKAEHTET